MSQPLFGAPLDTTENPISTAPATTNPAPKVIPLTLAQRVRKLGLITNAEIPLDFAISIPTTQNTPTLAIATPAFNLKVEPGGSLLYALALNPDNNTAQNYSFRVFAGTTNNIFVGHNGQTLGFISFPSGGSFNPIAEGTAVFLPGNSTIAVYIYNSGGSATAGTLSIVIQMDNLGVGDLEKILSQV